MGKTLFCTIVLIVLCPLFGLAQLPDGAVVITSPDGLRQVAVGAGTPTPLIVSCPDGTCAGGGGAAAQVDLTKVGGVVLGGANIIDVPNTAIRTNCVVGCAGVSPISSTGTLAAANAAVTLALSGQPGVGFHFTDAAFVGSLAAEISMDGAVTWGETDLYLTLSATTYNRLSRLTSPGLSGNFAIATPPGTTNVRVRVQTYTSGSSSVVLSATAVPFIPPLAIGAQDSFVQGIQLVGGRYAGISGTMMPLVVTDSAAATNGMGLIVRDPQLAVATGGAANTLGAQIMVKDNTSGAMAPVSALSTSPVGTEPALLVRNIPSGTQPISAAALPLPTGASTSGLQTTGNTSLASIDGKLTNPLPVSATALPLPTGAATAARQDLLLTELQLKADLTETQPVSVATLPLPTGAATEATLLNTLTTSAFQARVNTLGQKAMAASTPVVIASDQTSIPVAATLTAETTKVIGTVNVAAGQSIGLAAGTVVSTKTALTFNAPTAASVGVASASALAANASRKGLIAVNTSNATISCSVAQTAILNSGITLQPGAVWNMNEYSFGTGAVNCIASLAASNLSLQETQ